MTPKEKQLFEAHSEWAVSLGLRLFRKRAGGKSRDCDGNDRHDYQQAALMALLDVIPKYRPSLGQFRPFAAKRVYGRIVQAFRDQDEVGRSQRDRGVQHPTTLLDHPALDNDGDRAMCLKDLIQAPQARDRTEIFDSLDTILFGLHLGHRAVLFLTLICEYGDALVACVLGLGVPRVAQLRQEAMDHLGRQGVARRKRHWQPGERARRMRQLPLFEESPL